MSLYRSKYSNMNATRIVASDHLPRHHQSHHSLGIGDSFPVTSKQCEIDRKYQYWKNYNRSTKHPWFLASTNANNCGCCHLVMAVITCWQFNEMEAHYISSVVRCLQQVGNCNHVLCAHAHLGECFKTTPYQRTVFFSPIFLGTAFSNSPFSKKLKNNYMN